MSPLWALASRTLRGFVDKFSSTLSIDHSNHDQESDQPLPEEKIFKDDELVSMIDPILATDDKNQDGFIDYPEFVLAQQAAQARS